jgi:hypothetical protein
MPYRYAIDAERRLVVTTAWGRVTFAELRAHQEQLASDPRFNPEFNQLVDATAVTGLNVSVDEAKKIVSRTLFSPTSRRAFLGSGLSVLAVGRLMQAFAHVAKGREQISVFHERDAALKWLGLTGMPPKS